MEKDSRSKQPKGGTKYVTSESTVGKRTNDSEHHKHDSPESSNEGENAQKFVGERYFHNGQDLGNAAGEQILGHTRFNLVMV
jgi:hypothetical protein